MDLFLPAAYRDGEMRLTAMTSTACALLLQLKEHQPAGWEKYRLVRGGGDSLSGDHRMPAGEKGAEGRGVLPHEFFQGAVDCRQRKTDVTENAPTL